MTFAELLRRQGASPDAVALMRLGQVDIWGDGVETVSALALLRELALRWKTRQSYLIQGGSDRLPKALATTLAEKIRYGAPVVAIEQDPRGVRVTWQDADGRQTLTADRVICTVPFSVLRTIPVSPPLAPAKRRAIEELAYTSVTQVYLQSRTQFWGAEGATLTANTDLPVMWCAAFSHPGPRGILESFMTGPQARHAAAMAEGDRLAFTLAEMEKVFPGVRDHYEGGASYCWDQDEWARGDYAWFKPGQMTSLLPVIATPEGRIHFAGDHTSAWPGWMQGALESGNRAAKEVNEAP
jgi:monoamine oxidase